MAHRPSHNPASPEAIALGYQPEAIGVRWLGVFLILFSIGMIGLALIVWRVMESMESRNAQADVPRSVLHLDQQPPPPNLQPSVGHDASDAQDLAATRDAEDALFRKLGWSVDAGTHEVRIPPEIAQRVAEEAQRRAAAPYIPPTTTGKESNSILPGVKGGP